MVRDTRTDSVPTGWFFDVLWISMLFIAGFFCYFILPKMEVSWKTQGMRTPAWATVLIEISHFRSPLLVRNPDRFGNLDPASPFVFQSTKTVTGAGGLP